MSRSVRGNEAVDRRGFLSLSAGGLGALALNASPLSLASALAAGRSPAFPNYYPAKVATPDIPGNAKGGSPGYVTFPKTLVKSVLERPAKGGDVSAMALLGASAPPTPVERNSGWQQLNNELGTNLKLLIVPQADYAAKWGTVTAGGDLPDLLHISIVPVLPNVAAFLHSSCADLSQYLGGDAVKDYPNLANLPSASWNGGMIGGKLWGVPSARAIGGWPLYVQTTLLEKLGMAGASPKNADEFKAFCKALTNPTASRWAFGVSNDTTVGPYSMTWFQGVFRAPNNWRLGSNGGLVKDIETEEFKAALVYLRELIEAGYMSPDVKSNVDLNSDLFAGKIAMRANAWNSYQGLLVDQAAKLNQVYRIVPPFGFDGKAGATMLGPGNFGWTAVKKASPDRIKELLRVFNYLAAPFGSEEFMVTKYGVKGEDWAFDDRGTPKLTPQGIANMAGTPSTVWDRLAGPPHWLFSSAVPDYARFGSEDENKLLDVGVADPTQGHYSPTDAKKGAPLARLIFDRVSGIAAGRKPISDLAELVKEWRAQGGDEIRAEYEKAISF